MSSFDSVITVYFNGESIKEDELMKWCKAASKQLWRKYAGSYDAVYMGKEGNIHMVDFLMGHTAGNSDLRTLASMLARYRTENPTVEVDHSHPEAYKPRYYPTQIN